MSSNYIRVTVVVDAKDPAKAAKAAQDMREAKVGDQIGAFVANIIGPHASKTIELVKAEDEHLIHACDTYSEGDCSVCRYAVGRNLESTQHRFF